MALPTIDIVVVVSPRPMVMNKIEAGSREEVVGVTLR
jgi:hypothetical protein